jgi:chromosome segregation protein
MLLTKLEIKGFKSFGDKVLINFDQGITGIVGPNGCGKSNVVDAFRWVLGEQKTRNLRSDKMEDVIFNGTKNRKPLQMAEVSLTFKNTKNLLPTEYSEVTITRKYYRSGESEYQLNGVNCRLKDINNLFMDTGIGPDSYAIIELKMVEAILNDKDGSRRELFEEAAGVSKFKKRKKETLKKLEDTDADLARVEDLLFEIQKNLKNLEKQAKQAEKYFEVKDEYRKNSIALAHKSVSTFDTTLEKITNQIQAEQTALTEINAQQAKTESELEKLKNNLLSKEKLLSSRQKTLNDFVAKIRNYESEKKIKNERVKYLTDRKNTLSEQLKIDKESFERSIFSISGIEKEIANESGNLIDFKNKLEELKQSLLFQQENSAVIQKQINELNSVQKDKQTEVYNLTKASEIKEIQLSSLKQELERFNTDSVERTSGIAEFDKKISELNTSIENTRKKLQKLTDEELKIQEKITFLEQSIETSKDNLFKNNRILDAKQNEYNLTKSMVENLEGFPDAIKFLKKNNKWAFEAPLLSDIIAVDERYRVAIENYLESYTNYYLVEKAEQAYQAINLLSDASKGKGNFFILSEFKDFKGTPQALFNGIKPALEIIEVEDKYKKLVSYLLDDVYLVENDTEIPTDNNHIYISISGKFTKRKFSISGGSVGLFEGKRIGRAKNLEKLEQEIKKLSATIEISKNELNKKQTEYAEIRNNTQKPELDKLQKELNLLEQEFVSVNTKREQFNELLISNTSRKEDVLEKINQIKDALTNENPEIKILNEDLVTLNNKLNDINADFTIQNEELTKLNAQYNQQNILYHQQENKVKSLEQELSFKKTSAETSGKRIETATSELKTVEDEIVQMLNTAEVKDDELVEMYKEKEAIEGGLSEAEKEYYAQRAEIVEFEKIIKDFQHKKESATLLIAELQNKLNETNFNITALKDRLSVEFNIDLNNIDWAEYTNYTHFTEEELKAKVISLKNSLEKFGPINHMALEAFNEMKERNDFIVTQKEDLAKAKNSLLETIAEIDTIAKETFMTSFTQIRENFINVFRSLFTEEDTCDLRLVDAANPLESEIEIMAKPKGKRPLTINQLSGGEKTLTATSLLFAIYLLKPAPFCIFDEVDAPLDDANIDKFNNIIRKFSDNSQFIIVTHNKRTMASTDIIYGITMLEQGVSRVVPVDLRELE